MKSSILLIISSLLCFSALAKDVVAPTYEQALATWAASKSNPGWLEYLNLAVEFNYEYRIDEQGGCYKKGSLPVKLVTTTNSEGVITSVVANVSNPKSECFKKVLLGVKFPKPPYAPFYDHWEMR
jgi:hypothetical protein